MVCRTAGNCWGFEKIRACYEQIAHFQILGDDDQAAIADAKFHLAIAEASHNLVLIQMMRGLFDLLQYNVVLGRRKVYTEAHRFDQLHDQHFQVMDAIERQDQKLPVRQCVDILNL